MRIAQESYLQEYARNHTRKAAYTSTSQRAEGKNQINSPFERIDAFHR